MLVNGNYNNYNLKYKTKELGSNIRWKFYSETITIDEEKDFDNKFHFRTNENGIIIISMFNKSQKENIIDNFLLK